MKKQFYDIFSISRNERIALICVIIVISIVLVYKAFLPPIGVEKTYDSKLEHEFLKAMESVKTDTVAVKKKRNKKTKESAINTATSLKKVDTILE